MLPRFLLVFLTLLPLTWLICQHQVSGIVTDADGPIVRATVRLPGTLLAYRTDEQGRFDWPQPLFTRLTASKPGYLIGYADDPLVRLPMRDCERYEWIDPTPDRQRPQQCGNCHREIHREWNDSSHAHSASSASFRYFYGHVQRNLPDRVAVCHSCHAPTQSPLSDLLHSETPTALQGVHCDYCHKVVGVAGGEWGLQHGRYQLNLLRPDPEAEPAQLFFGPLDDVARGEDAYAPIYRDSRYCAACHEGIVFGVHAYSTYREYLSSAAKRAGKECQHCHMAPTGTMTNIAPGNGGIERPPSTLANHRFFQGSRLEMLRRSLHVVARRDANEVTASITARNVGHALPTGFPSRQIVVRLTQGNHVQDAIFGKRLRHRESDAIDPPYWLAAPEYEDTRLLPDQMRTVHFPLTQPHESATLTLIDRRFGIGSGYPPNDHIIGTWTMTTDCQSVER